MCGAEADGLRSAALITLLALNGLWIGEAWPSMFPTSPTTSAIGCSAWFVLGGDTTAVAAAANVVVIGIAAPYRQPISVWKFTKYGLLVTAVTLLIAWPYVWGRYYALN